MTSPNKEPATISDAELADLVAEADMGGRKPIGLPAKLLTVAAISWSLFQLWYASPLPFMLNFGIFNDTAARAFHLSFALFLTYLAYPAFSTSSREKVPVADWCLVAVALCCVNYLVVFYGDLALRPGLPTAADITVSVLGVLLLVEASRRAEGPWMPVISIAVLAYVFAGPYMPGMMAHKGASLGRAASHFWLTSEGVFGVALGVSTNFIFLFVLFGSLLDKAGAGNYFIQVAFALLGRFRGGPAKAAIVSSCSTGMISGSSVANVVTTGVFTIPLMKRVGYTPVKAGGIECAAGVNGQLMPPVMGAAAFLMAEYVGISYAEVCKHAFIPAILTYAGLFYVVDLEAVKAGMVGITPVRRRTLQQGVIKGVLTICSLIILGAVVSWTLGWTKTVFGEYSAWVASFGGLIVYLGLVYVRAKNPDLPIDDLRSPLVKVPDFYEAAKTGLHYIVPVFVLIWCLMIEEMSSGLAAFWGVMTMAGVVISQKPLTAWFRGEGRLLERTFEGFRDMVAGLEQGGRNMTGVGIATATAGILVGAVTLTGIGLVMTEIVEFISGDSIVIMLAMVAFICILLGTGLPTTASYVVVATLMAPVVVELAAQNNLAVPLIAVHMFVFYFGLMADVSPPVGLAAYAAGAIAGADPIDVGWQGTWYGFRTAILPFVFIFNPQLLLIDIHGWWHLLVVLFCASLAMVAFCAALQGWFFTRNRWWETALLLLVCFTLFRPNYWMDFFYADYEMRPPNELQKVIETIPPGFSVHFRILTTDVSGDDVIKTARLSLADKGTAQQRLAPSGVVISAWQMEPMISSVRPGSEAARLKLRPGDKIESVRVPKSRPDPFLFAVPALAILGGLALLQIRRRQSERLAPVSV